jgi:hypothetical protein
MVTARLTQVLVALATTAVACRSAADACAVEQARQVAVKSGVDTRWMRAEVGHTTVRAEDYLATRPYLRGTPTEAALKGHVLRHVSFLPITLVSQIGGSFEVEEDASSCEVLRSWRGQ